MHESAPKMRDRFVHAVPKQTNEDDDVVGNGWYWVVNMETKISCWSGLVWPVWSKKVNNPRLRLPWKRGQGKNNSTSSLTLSPQNKMQLPSLFAKFPSQEQT